MHRLARVFLIPTRLSSRLNARPFCDKPASQDVNAKKPHSEADRLADQARMSQNLWDFMVPERNMGVTHPFFLVLLVLTLSLHFYNNYRDEQEDIRLRNHRIHKKSVES